MNCRLPALAFIATLLAGCAAPGSTDNGGTAAAPAPAARDDGYCDAAAVQNQVGRAYSERTAESARSRSGARTLRVLQPGQVMTMEYNPARLTLVVDDKGNIGSARCG